MLLEIEKSGSNLLDLLLVIAENIKLLILGPVLIGLLALGIGYALPQSFTSQAILKLPSEAQSTSSGQAAAMMVSPLVLDPVIKTFHLEAGLSMERARVALASQIKVTVGKDNLLRLDVTAHSPEVALKMANSVIDYWLKSTSPGALDRADLEKRLSYAKTSLESVRHLLEHITSGSSGLLNKPLTLGEAGTSVVALGELQARFLGDVLTLPRILQGLTRDVVIQPPTLPTEPVSPKKGLMAILTALVSGFVFLLWIIVRNAWASAQKDPRDAEKQSRIRAAFGFKTRQV